MIFRIYFSTWTSPLSIITILLSLSNLLSNNNYVNCYQGTNNIPQLYQQQKQQQLQQQQQKYYSDNGNKKLQANTSTLLSSSSSTKPKTKSSNLSKKGEAKEEEDKVALDDCGTCKTEEFLLKEFRELSFSEISDQVKEELLFASIGFLIGVERDLEVGLASV